ncbi:hypothetical protein M9158_004692 [Salmonella enterica]|nr:hypothetical protein [Salmonella enterica]EDC7034787.1 hypothetical protein [Salmonella enterica subsp. enterica serovar Muenchen]EDN2444583.1 hypothetical protein [Salmonella enterica]EDQ9357870.1 hypothetical protein [Salmonella enterica]EDX5817368.1 hypothetical protein [Salmonella enterica subsp. enterica serovar Muenchen]
MQQVKIYTASPSDLSPPVQSESFCVDMVLASDYAELEEKFMALAAENAGLKAAKEIIRHLNVNREEANFCGIDDCYIDDAVAAMITPVTDAFLAEVRAQGVERYAAQLKSEAVLADETGWDGAAKFLISESEKVLAFAAQLRQEADK